MRLFLPLLVALAAPLAGQGIDCDGYLTSLAVPQGFCVRVFAQRVGAVRHAVVHPTGVLVAATRLKPGLLRLEDRDGDGRADTTVAFGPGVGGSGVTWRDGWLYFASEDAIYRYRWPASARAPEGEPELAVSGLPRSGAGWAHNAKGIAVGKDGSLYVSFGSASDNCQVDPEIPAPGKFPCPDLQTRAGVWRLTPPPSGKGEWTRTRLATGLRNAMAIGVDPRSNRVWAVSHGRDFLNRFWGWSNAESAMQPAEILAEILLGTDFGWPYCMGRYTPTGTTLIRAPEYQNATGREVECGRKTVPSAGYPGHWAPMALAFAPPGWPAEWNQGMLIAFHGSRSRRPLPEDGHYVVLQPLNASGTPAGSPQVLLKSLGAPGTIRPTGLALGPGGVLYVTDDDHGRIYRVEPRPPTRR